MTIDELLAQNYAVRPSWRMVANGDVAPYDINLILRQQAADSVLEALVEFRRFLGIPASEWMPYEISPEYRVHAALETALISLRGTSYHGLLEVIEEAQLKAEEAQRLASLSSDTGSHS